MHGGDLPVSMKTRSVTRLAVLTLLLQLGGCAAFQSRWPFGSHRPPAERSSVRAHRQSPASAVSEQPAKEERETNRAGTVRKEPAVAGEPAPSASAPVSTTDVTLEDNDGDHLRAQALVNDAAARLARIDRSKLTGERATAYNEASDLANAARQAMMQQDYLAASGLARKATLLTEQLASRTSSR